MDEYKEFPSNSKLSKEHPTDDPPEQERERHSVVKSTVTTKKKSAVRKFTERFIQKDLKDIMREVVTDVIEPAFKDLIYNTITNSISMALYDRPDGFGPGGRRRESERTPYRSYFDDRSRREPHRPEPVRNFGFEYDDIVFTNRGDADTVLFEMERYLDKYKIVSLFEYFDYAGQDAPYTYQNWGWTSLRNARVSSVRDGYIIELPRVMQIK